ncbi:hypothetical protein ABZP36_028886 [Zizania latifolia]
MAAVECGVPAMAWPCGLDEEWGVEMERGRKRGRRWGLAAPPAKRHTPLVLFDCDSIKRGNFSFLIVKDEIVDEIDEYVNVHKRRHNMLRMPKATSDAKLLSQSLGKAYAATPTNLKAHLDAVATKVGLA